MNNEQFNELMEQIAASQGNNLLHALDILKNHIADARNGEWDIATRKCAIACIDEKLYNVIKKFLTKKSNAESEYFGTML
jgi:hypothetical protein